MSISDYRRPADYQIDHVYQCDHCSAEAVLSSFYAGPTNCACGGRMMQVGECYPADSAEWHEERDNVNDDFENRSGRW